MIILGTNSIKETGFNVDNSCRFNGDAYVHKAVSAGNQRTFTYSFWTKRSTLNNYDTFIGYAGTAGGGGGTNRGELIFVGDGDDTLRVGFNPGGSSWSNYTVSDKVFRDPSAWYHIVLKVNTTSGTEAERLKIFVNGVSQGLSGYPGQNFDTGFNVNGSVYHIGRSASGTGNFIKGYLAEAVFIDGTALDADSFGEFDEDSGIWKPIDVSGLTFGTNGFYLDFEDSANLGNDANGGTDLTEVNLAATDQSTDTCTNNFATLNPLHSIGASSELSQGNLEYDPSGHHRIISTIAPSSGKWYAEVKGIDNPDKFNAGVCYYPIPANGSISSFAFGQGINGDVGRWSNDFGIKANGDYGHNNSWSSYMASLEGENNNIVGIYMDLDNYKLYFSKNGSLVSSTGKDLTNNGYPYGFISVGEAATFQWNFGNPSFAISSGNTDDNGYGNFEYSPNITGDGAAKKFYSLNSKNLAEYGG